MCVYSDFHWSIGSQSREVIYFNPTQLDLLFIGPLVHFPGNLIYFNPTQLDLLQPNPPTNYYYSSTMNARLQEEQMNARLQEDQEEASFLPFHWSIGSQYPIHANHPTNYYYYYYLIA